MPENSAYLVPPTGFTQHGNLNLSQDRVDWWLYVARGAGGGGGRGGGPVTSNGGGAAPPNANANANAGGRGANPNVVRDRASVEAANVPGKPLKQ